MRYTCLPPSDNKNKSPSLLELLDVLCSHGSADCFEPSFVSDHIVRVVNSASRRRLGKLDTYTVLEYLCSKNVPPVSVLTALIFIEKLVVSNPDSPLLTEVTAFDLFAVSVVVASKYLHDDDTDYGMYNADWASEFDMDLKELNELEVKFILALNWEFFVTKAQILRFGFEIGVFNRPAKSTSAGDKLEFRFPALSCLVRNLSSHKIRAVSKIVFVLAVAYMSMNNYSDCSLSINCPNSNQTRLSSEIANHYLNNISSKAMQPCKPKEVDQKLCSVNLIERCGQCQYTSCVYEKGNSLNEPTVVCPTV